MENTISENAAVIEAAKEWGNAELLDIDHPTIGEAAVAVLSVPNGRTIQSVKKFSDEYRTAPERKRGTAKLSTLGSFVEHAKRTKDADSVIFADDNPQAPALLAVYDYNTAAGAPRFGEHRARYAFPLSDEWKAWQGVSAGEKPMTMQAFAEFLEDRIGDVILPEEGQDSIKTFAVRLGITLATPQQLMTLSRGLKVNVDKRVAQAQNLASGEGQIQFSEEHKDDGGAPMRVPGGFAIRIPVFRSDARYDVPVRLRYRVGQGTISWLVSLYRVDVIFADAIGHAADTAHAETGLPVLFGSPES